VAIANERLLTIDDGRDVSLHGLPRQRGGPPEDHDLEATEFIRRFLLHVLPPGFHRIRYYGLFGNRHRADRLAQCRRLLGMPAPPVPLVPPAACTPRTNPLGPRCPVCHEGHMIPIDEVPQDRYGTRLDTS
jgi:hypothetical protein